MVRVPSPFLAARIGAAALAMVCAVFGPEPALAGSSIVVAGQAFDVGRPVVLWNDPEGFDGYAQSCLEAKAAESSPCCQRTFNRFAGRKDLTARTLPALQK